MPELKKDKLKALKELKAKVVKAYGSDILMTGKEAVERGALSKIIIPTPSLELNQALYCGGFGGIVELFGPPASGKTSLAIETLAKAQKEDPNFIGMWLETEHSIFPELLEQHGVDLERLVYINQEDFESGENALDIIYSAVRNGIPNLVIINSVAGIVPKQETEEDLSKQNIALVARMMSKFFRKIVGAAGKNKVDMIFINQIRDNVGVMYGDTTTTTGGRALGFYASQRVKLTACKVQKEDPIEPEKGIKVSCIVYKNRFAGMHNPNSKCTYYAMFDTGIDSIISIPKTLADNGIFMRSGAWWYYPNKENPATIAGIQCKFNSQNALINALRDNKDFLTEVKKFISVNEVSAEEKQEITKDEQSNADFVQSTKDPTEDKNDDMDEEIALHPEEMI